MVARQKRYEHPLITFTKMMRQLGPYDDEVVRFYLSPDLEKDVSVMLGFARRSVRASIAIKIARNCASIREKIWAKSDKKLIHFARLVMDNYEAAERKLIATPKGPETRAMEAVIIQWNILLGAARRKVIVKR